MSHPDVPEAAKSLLQAEGYSPVVVSRLDAVGKMEAIVLRPAPSTTSARYVDGSRRVAYVLQVLCKRESELQAMEDSHGISELLDMSHLPSPTDSYQFVSAEIYTEPQELGVDESGFYVWELRIRANIII